MNGDFEYVDPTPEEQEALKRYLQFLSKQSVGFTREITPVAVTIAPAATTMEILTFNIPYSIPIAGALVTGMLYIRDPIENSYTDGVVTGVVIGDYHLDRNKTEVRVYDPTGSLFRLDIKLSFNDENVSGRICRRKYMFPYKWKCNGWITLASW